MKKFILYAIPILLIVFLSCEDIIYEEDISDAKVTLVAPVDNARFFSTGITFTWNEIENGTQYRIQIARPNFDAPLEIVSDMVVDTTSFTTQLNIGNYEWRVQAVNSAYSSAFSKRAFSIVSNEDFQNNSVALLSPDNNVITNTASQNLTWQSVIGATGYDVQIVNTANNTIVSEQEVTGTNLSYNFPDGNFQWKVRATNGDQTTLYSARSILIDKTVPNTPVLTSPANQSNSSNNDVTFQWSRTPIAGTTEKDSIYIFTNSQLTNLQYKNEHTSPYNNSSLNNGTYYWYVKSFDAAGNVSLQSAVFSFTLN
mgnify:CR=1 FL=1